MAIVTQTRPDTNQPIYNNLAWQFSSSNSGDTNYRYIVTVTVDAVDVRVRRIRPRPSDGWLFFDLSKDLQPLLDQTVFDITSTADFQDAPFIEYDLEIDSENSDPVETPNTELNFIAYNTRFDLDTFLSYDENDYILNDTTPAELLWNIENYTLVDITDIFYIHFIGNVSDYVEMYVEQYDKAGNIVPSAGYSTNKTLTVGPNLARLDLTDVGIVSGAEVLGVRFYDAKADPISDEVFLTIEDLCSSYTNTRLVYLDSKGSYNSLNFNMKSSSNLSINEVQNYRGYINPITQTGETRGIKRFYQEEEETFKISTQVLTEKHNRMFRDLLESTQVFIDVRSDSNYTNTDFLPIEVLTRSFEPKKDENGELQIFELEYKLTTKKMLR